MFQSLRYQIHVLFTKIRHFVMDDTSTNIIPFVGVELPVSLQAVPASKYPQLRHVDDVFIKRICWFKRPKHPYHEFLVFHVETIGTPVKKSVIMVERGVSAEHQPSADEEPEYPDSEGNYELEVENSEEAPSTPQRAPRRSVGETALTSSWSLSSSFIPDSPSQDVLTFSGTGDDLFITPGAILCRQLKITDATFTIAQLVVLVRVVHDHHRAYRLLQYQCYWFSKVIYDVIKLKCGGDETANGHERQLGKFGGIRVRMGKKDTFEIVSKKYDAAWAIVKNEVRQKRRRQQKAAEDAEKAKRIDQVEAELDSERRARQEVEMARQAAEADRDAAEHARQEAEAELIALKALLGSQHP